MYSEKTKINIKLWIGLAIMMILAPLGLLASGTAWGEWGSDEIRRLIGYIPKGLERFIDFWRAPLPDYTFRGWEEAPFLYVALAYIASAVVGVTVVVALSYFLGKLLARKEENS